MTEADRELVRRLRKGAWQTAERDRLNAADRIEALAAENARLQGLLKDTCDAIEDYADMPSDYFDDLVATTRAALSPASSGSATED